MCACWRILCHDLLVILLIVDCLKPWSEVFVIFFAHRVTESLDCPLLFYVLQPERVMRSADSEGYGITSDVWSFGITMVVMQSLFA